MPHYSAITIIYNPKSTGSSQKLAEALRLDLEQLLPKQAVKLVATEYVGHAEELAYELAKASPRPLIISSSGDGGYHEVINGLLRAQAEGATPTAGLLPAGNANDHFNSLHVEDTAKLIASAKSRTIDVLKFRGSVAGKPVERYAHSYIGIGLTPRIGKQLNKASLNGFREAWIVARELLLLRPVHVHVRGKRRAYHSLIFSNVGKMSKVLSISRTASVDDGKFEITAFRRRSKLLLIAVLLRATTRGLAGDKQATKFSFATIKPTAIQLDGEIMTLDAGAEASIAIVHKLLSCSI